MVGSPANGCVGLSPAICSMFGVTSCASHCEPSVDCAAAWNLASSDGPSAGARFCAAVCGETAGGSVGPRTSPFRRAFDRSIEASRDWISLVERTAGVYCALPELARLQPLLHVLAVGDLLVADLAVDPADEVLDVCDAVSRTDSHSLMLACTFSPVSGSLKSVMTPQADGYWGSG